MKKLTKKNAIIIGAISLVLVAAILCIILIPNCNGNPPDENTEDKPIIIVEATDKTFLSAGTTQYVVVRPSEPTNYEEYAVEELVKYFSKLLKSHFELTNDYFYNANHLNGDGATKLEPIITNIYNDLKNYTYNASNYFYNSYSEMMADYNK